MSVRSRNTEIKYCALANKDIFILKGANWTLVLYYVDFIITFLSLQFNFL